MRFDAIDGLRDARAGRAARRRRGQARGRRGPALHRATWRRRSARCSTLTEALGVEPQNLAVRRATLEDVFLDLTGRALRD